MSVGTTCRVYLIRHGETDWNDQGILQGASSIPLNKTGREQATLLKEKLADVSYSAIISSDLMRAFETAVIVREGKEIPIIRCAELQETKLGRWEGRKVSDLKEYWKSQGINPDKFNKEEYLNFKWCDVESYREVYTRTTLRIVAEATARLGSTILMFTHGGVIDAILHNINFKEGHRWKIQNCGYLTLCVNCEGEITIIGSEDIELVKV